MNRWGGSVYVPARAAEHQVLAAGNRARGHGAARRRSAGARARAARRMEAELHGACMLVVVRMQCNQIKTNENKKRFDILTPRSPWAHPF